MKRMMVHLVTAALAIVFIVYGATAGCSQAHRQAVAEDVIDCTVNVARAHSAEYGALVEAAMRAAVRPDGSIDWTAIREAAAGFGLHTGACTLAAVVARLLAPAPPTLGVMPPGPALQRDDLRAGWERLRREMWSGRRFRVEGGVL